MIVPPRLRGIAELAHSRPRRRHAFTVDVEDWYHGIPIDRATAARAERRLDHGVGRLLDLLAEHAVQGTFFILGLAAEEHPRLVARIAEAGHEIGCHGWTHDPLYTMTPARMREETRRGRDRLAEITGREITIYRAPYFSITGRSLWALDVLAELGFTHDSSIIPVTTWRYGIAGFDSRPVLIPTPSGAITEIPITTRRMMRREIPVAGGAYFRLYPYALTRSNLLATERENRSAVFYLHPWELDPDHPTIDFHWRARLTHYARLGTTAPKLRRLLREFSFGPLREAHAAPILSPSTRSTP